MLWVVYARTFVDSAYRTAEQDYDEKDWRLDIDRQDEWDVL